MKHFLLGKFIFLLLISAPLSAATFSACYGTLDGICKAPSDIKVLPALEMSLPGDFTFTTDESRASVTVTIQDGLTWTSATLDDTNGPQDSFVAGSTTILSAGNGGTWSFKGLKFTGPVVAGDTIKVSIRAWNPNGTATTLLDTSFVVASIKGVTEINVSTFNPGSNNNQQSILRVVNPNSTPALIRINALDDSGSAGGDTEVLVEANQAIQLNSTDLEDGNAAKGVLGGLGKGVGKWRLTLVSDSPSIKVHNLVRNNSNGTISDFGGVD